MSRQAKKPRLVLVPDEVSPAPGKAEAEAIRALYATAQEGIRAFVLMGFRLIALKARLPHGQYMAWIRMHLAELTPGHLHRSRMIAEGIALRLGWDGQIDRMRSICNALPPEVCDLIEGKSYRTLLTELRDPLGEAERAREEASRLLCEEIWTADPGQRDEWEPRVLAGEVSYRYAHTGMLGALAMAGKQREDREIWNIFDAKLCAMRASFRKMEPLVAGEARYRESLVNQIRGWAKMEMPPVLLEVWKEALLPLELGTAADGEEGPEA
jgi:hypothetical protein